MLLAVLAHLVGVKGVEIKVDNPENYNFRPREMLHEVHCDRPLRSCVKHLQRRVRVRPQVSSTLVHFARHDKFHASVAESGYFNQNAGLMPKSLATLQRLRILTEEQLTAYEALCTAVEVSARLFAEAMRPLFHSPSLDRLLRVPCHQMTLRSLMPRTSFLIHCYVT